LWLDALAAAHEYELYLLLVLVVLVVLNRSLLLTNTRSIGWQISAEYSAGVALRTVPRVSVP